MKQKEPDLTEVVTPDLRALLFWAQWGVEHAKGGSYARDIVHIIESYSATVRPKRTAVWGKYHKMKERP